MISEKEFELLLKKSESSTLDFKRDIYDFKNDRDKSNTAKFVKDVVSFANTIRTETSFIIFGIGETELNDLELFGISTSIDDSILQEKVKDKLNPRPVFSYYTISYKNKEFGLLEFPIVKYEFPIMPIVKNLKGLNVGKVYYRNGTSNTEANAYDIIRINDWFKSLPSTSMEKPLNEQMRIFLNRLTKGEEKLSVIISDLLIFAKENSYYDLEKFCLNEIQGIKSKKNENFKYRIQKVILSWNKIDVNPYSFEKPTVETIRREMLNTKGFFEQRFLMFHSLIEIEGSLKKISLAPNSYGTMKVNSKTLFDMEEEVDLFIYTFPDNFNLLYQNIRQKTIDLLMQLK